ncbi:juvenile hormone esterase-like [Planococcus citri]|uniref:juvenile hormone esterase-like n=1 Tax=Planococcus citri TaxID=170843 RepID=UPI0031F7AD67
MREELCVTIPQGKLVGKEWISTFTGDTYYGFSGIPYAKTPTGELRFKAPEPADNWEGVRDATIEGSDCMQFNLLEYVVQGSEDCLYANVYSPEPPCKITKLKPVMVMIHWGGSAWGSGSAKLFGNVDYMMNSDIVIVTFNYRLHIFGFLNLGIPECPGNMGLKDQVMLLKWVQNNIKYFGGDPNDVTLFGSSSGASNANLHMMSPMSEGLFHKVILQSGHGLIPLWGYQKSPFDRALELAVVMGFSGQRTPIRLLEFFKRKSGRDLIAGFATLRHLSKEQNDVKCETCLFLPSVEKIKEGAFMYKTPREMMADIRPVPTLLSMNEKEGILAFCADMFKIIPKKLGKSIREHLWQYNVSADTIRTMTKTIRSFYFKKKDEPTVDEIINLYTDLWFCEWNNTIDLLATHPDSPPVYIYHFTFDGEYNFSKKFFAKIMPEKFTVTGAIHADDASYLIAYKMFLEETNGKIEYKPKESEIIRKMVSIVTTFVKTGNPNNESIREVNWKPFHPENPSHLLFDEKLSIVDGRINPDRVALWNEFIDCIKNKESTCKPEKTSAKILSDVQVGPLTMSPNQVLQHMKTSYQSFLDGK